MPEDTAEDLEEEVAQNAQKATKLDVCKTPTPAGEVPVPYPNISESSNTTSGSKKVKIEGKEVMTKGASYKKSSGDETGQSESNLIERITNVVKTKKLFNVPIVVWGVATIILIIMAWILTSSGPQPAEHLEYIIHLVQRNIQFV